MLKTCDMWSKIYLGVLGLSIAAMAFFTYYSWSWLGSIGEPSAAIAGYEYHSGLARPALWFSVVILLIIGNVVLWTSGRAWALWTTFLYAAIFIVTRHFWLGPSYWAFWKKSGFAESGFSADPFFGAILIVVVAAVVFFDQFAVVRLRQKMYPPVVPDDPTPKQETEPIE